MCAQLAAQAQPLALQKLAAFLHDAHFQDKKRDKPVVVIGPKDAAGRCLVVGFSGNPRSGTVSGFHIAPNIQRHCQSLPRRRLVRQPALRHGECAAVTCSFKQSKVPSIIAPRTPPAAVLLCASPANRAPAHIECAAFALLSDPAKGCTFPMSSRVGITHEPCGCSEAAALLPHVLRLRAICSRCHQNGRRARRRRFCSAGGQLQTASRPVCAAHPAIPKSSAMRVAGLEVWDGL